jgi:hypothetical protein
MLDYNRPATLAFDLSVLAKLAQSEAPFLSTLADVRDRAF